ncbi:MAG: hypothetical protein OES47_04300 [Acidobacteriota bacterium]|nr:hypothetical protein [Acidobacteriota bacterium]
MTDRGRDGRLLEGLIEALGFEVVLGAGAALIYALVGAGVLYVCRILVRRRREISWSRFMVAVLVATAVATGTMFVLADSIFSSGNVGGGSGIGAVIAVVFAFVGGGIGGLFVLLISGLLLGSSRGSASPPISDVAARGRGGSNLGRLVLRLALMAAPLPALFLSLAIGEGADTLLPWLDVGELAPYVLFALGALGLAGLRESLFCSESDTGRDKKITKFLLWIGIVGAGAGTGILTWIWLTSGRYLHRSNRPVAEWMILLSLSAAPGAIEAWQLRKLK